MSDKYLEQEIATRLAEFFDDPLGFVMWAFPWGQLPEMSVVRLPEPWRSQFHCDFGPDKWVCELLEDIGRGVRERGFDGVNAVMPQRIAIASGHGIGKSCLTALLVTWLMATRPHCKGIVTAVTASQLTTKTWAEINKWMKRSVVADMFEYTADSIRAKEAPETWRVDAVTCKEENSESFAGQHAASSSPFYIFDEASGISEKIFEVAEGGLTDGEPFMFMFGNPTRASGTFYAAFNDRKKRASWYTRHVDSRDVAITNKRQIEAWRDEYGEDSDFFRVRVRGEFPNQASNQFIPSFSVEEAMKRAPTDHPTVATIGVDVARYGDDDSVIFFRFGKNAKLPYRAFHGLSVVALAHEIKKAIAYCYELGFKQVYCFVDETGVGAGVVDILLDAGYKEVYGINFSMAADDSNQFDRKRDEIWGRAREWLKKGCLVEDEDLKHDLVAPEYEIRPSGAIKLESKESMKKRGLSSPDIADAFCLTFSMLIAEYSPEDYQRTNQHVAQARMDYNPLDFRF